MSNEHFLSLTFVLGGCLSVALGLVTYAWLRRPFLDMVACLRSPRLASVLKRLFLISKVAAGFLGFLSVSYYGSCPARSYQGIVSDRAYMLSRNQEQIAAALTFLVVAILAWGLLLTIILRLRGPAPTSKADSPHS